MTQFIDDFITMNQAGQVLELCQKYYHNKVIMHSDGKVFASSMGEAYNKQKGFIDKVKSFDVKLLSKVITDDGCELIFHYKMVGADAKVTEFTGKHKQTWKNDKIIKEQYFSL